MAELVGGALLSAFFQSLFTKIDSGEVTELFRGKKQFVGLLEKLRMTLLSVGVVLDDAELKQVRSPRVKEWLDELKDAAEDAENLLDEISTGAMHVKAEAESGGSGKTTSTMSRFISSVFDSSDRVMKVKVEEILRRLKYFARQKEVLGLKEGVGERPWKRLPSTSLVEESEVYGRCVDKSVVMKTVRSDDIGDESLVVIPIVGMGGVGKSTLAQAVYNDEEVRKMFEFKAWVCVSEEFDVCKVTKIILQAVASETCSDMDLNTVQVKLKERLKGRKFFFVLDDVWNENYVDWDVLRRPFHGGAQGSKIIVTTRSDKVASVMGTVPTYRLKELSDQDCWKLFVKHASRNGDFVANPELEGIGRKIVKKCRGLPLAAKTLGGLLRSTLDVSEWERVLRSEIWDFTEEESNILPALRVSYHYLPSHLKRCFAYCSIIPKDSEFDKDKLVLLWMAENLLGHSKGSKRLEDVGYEYFNDLVSRSFFQMSSATSYCVTMHDLIVDLARFVSGNCFQVGSDNSKRVMKQRHFAYQTHQHDSFETFRCTYPSDPSHLCSILSFNADGYSNEANVVVRDLVLKLKFLRSLSLSGCESLTQLPDSIGELRHLRYLDLSSTSISCLPDSITMLCNLQTLLLVNCVKLTRLPSDMNRLINLRYLDTRKSGLEMSPKISKLKNLQVLTDFYVGKDDETRLRELGELPNLRGNLCINNLRNVIDAHDSLEANLADKKYLEGLSLTWGFDIPNDTIHERLVLENLVPSTTLKYLEISGYGGTRFPNWLGDHSYSNMVSVFLNGFRQCTMSLPSLGQLPSLKTLHITHFNAIVTVGPEFYGRRSSSAMKPFASLHTLYFDNMSNWVEWNSVQHIDVSAPFPKLMHLCIHRCPRLIGSLPRSFPSLRKLEIIYCPRINCSLPNMPRVIEVNLANCDGLFPQALPPPTLERLAIRSCNTNLVSLSEASMKTDTCLKYLNVEECSSLTTLGTLPSALRTLRIDNCKKLEISFPLHHDTLEHISIWNACNSVLSFPLNSFTNLGSIYIGKFKNLESFSLVDGVSHVMSSLTNLRIDSCPNLVSLPGGGFTAPNLASLRIENCDKFKCAREEIHSRFPSLRELEISYCPEIHWITSPVFKWMKQ